MKNPLSYQITEYDCGPTTVMNAVSFLFKREEIRPDVIKHIMLYTLDSYNKKGESGKSGTSGMAMRFLCEWLNQYGKATKFPIHCEALRQEDVFVAQNSRLVTGLQQNGAAIVRLKYGCWHYVLFTGADAESVYLFDPYYRKQPFRQKDIKLIADMPEKWNRKVPYHYFNQEDGPYALGPAGTREATMLFNGATRAALVEAIEYFI